MGLFGKKKDAGMPTPEPEGKEDSNMVALPDEASFYKNQVEQLREKLYTDPLGCKTKAAFEEDVENFVAEGDFCLLVMNVNLERVNNKKGRRSGDEVLRAVSNIYYKHFPNLYHMGGEKFNILVKESSKYEEEMKLANVELARYLMENKVDIDIYYGMAKGSEQFAPDMNFSRTWQLYVHVAVERMYADKKKKRPKDRNIIKEELEAERLRKALEEKAAAQKALEEKVKELETQEAKEDAKQINEEISDFFEGLEEITEEMNRSKDTLEKIRKDKELEELAYIPHFPFEHDEMMETMTTKLQDTMWFFMSTIEISNDKEYHKIRIMVYPTAFEKPPLTVPCLVIIEDEINRHIYNGKNVAAGIAGTIFNINSRFTKDGDYNVTIIPREGDYKVVSKNNRVHPGVCTPYHFGKVFFDKEIYPIRKNVDGLMDCVVQTGNTFELCDGNLEHGGVKYQFIKNGSNFEIVEV